MSQNFVSELHQHLFILHPEGYVVNATAGYMSGNFACNLNQVNYVSSVNSISYKTVTVNVLLQQAVIKHLGQNIGSWLHFVGGYGYAMKTFNSIFSFYLICFPAFALVSIL